MCNKIQSTVQNRYLFICLFYFNHFFYIKLQKQIIKKHVYNFSKCLSVILDFDVLLQPIFYPVLS